MVRPVASHPCVYHLRSGRVLLGYAIPSIAFGTWTLGNGQGPIDQVKQALSVGFSHIGTS
jgi:diketogulonate reductase-like aldo/keto reductase